MIKVLSPFWPSVGGTNEEEEDGDGESGFEKRSPLLRVAVHGRGEDRGR
jgi:hypothetical protein